MKISIVIADDENLVRNLFISALSKYGDISIIGQAANGIEVINILKASVPDVLLLDLNMPKLSGLEVLEEMKAHSMRVNTLVISMNDSDATIWAAINAGALGFLFKTEDWDEMYNAIKVVAQGKIHYTERINTILLEMARRQTQNSLDSKNSKVVFTERELAIIRLLNDGLSSSEIGSELYCSRATVDRIRQELIHRVGAKNTVGLVSFAIRHKLFEVNSR